MGWENGSAQPHTDKLANILYTYSTYIARYHNNSCRNAAKIYFLHRSYTFSAVVELDSLYPSSARAFASCVHTRARFGPAAWSECANIIINIYYYKYACRSGSASNIRACVRGLCVFVCVARRTKKNNIPIRLTLSILISFQAVNFSIAIPCASHCGIQMVQSNQTTGNICYVWYSSIIYQPISLTHFWYCFAKNHCKFISQSRVNWWDGWTSNRIRGKPPFGSVKRQPLLRNGSSSQNLIYPNLLFPLSTVDYFNFSLYLFVSNLVACVRVSHLFGSLVAVQKRISQGLKVLQYYTTKNWIFKNDKFLRMRYKMNKADREKFNFNVEDVRV